MAKHPPRLARWLVSALAPASAREFLVGDLEERFALTLRAAGHRAAWRRYWRQAIASTWHAAAIGGGPARGGSPRKKGIDMSNLWRDVILGARTASRSPSYGVIAIVTMALAIGANTLLFSIANPLVMLYGVSARDPMTFGSVTVLVLVVSMLAVWSPAARAMRIDPARTLRSE